MKNEMHIITLNEPVTVTYREEDGEIYARALQFDLVGIGKTRAKALKELQELFQDYATDVLATKGNVRFFNPSDADEWENPDKEHFNVFFLVKKPVKLAAGCNSISDLRPIRNKVETIQLQPCLV